MDAIDSVLPDIPAPLVGYRAWESLMILLAEERGWEFTFEGEYVPVDAVFNASTYGPVLLTAVVQELAMRQIRADLAVSLLGDEGSLFGAKVVFDEERNSLSAQMWRLHAVAALIEQLPRRDRAYQLDPLPAVLPAPFRERLRQDVEG